MAVIVEQGKINNGSIVLAKPVSLPDGTPVRIQIEPIDTHTPRTTTDASKTLQTSPVLACGRTEQSHARQHSVVKKATEREKWQQRPTG